MVIDFWIIEHILWSFFWILTFLPIFEFLPSFIFFQILDSSFLKLFGTLLVFGRGRGKSLGEFKLC